VGCGRHVSLRNRANKELSTEEIGTKCVGSAATQGTDYWGVLAVVSDWSLPAFNYYRHQGSSRIEAKQALQFSNLELTNSQCISLKKKNL